MDLHPPSSFPFQGIWIGHLRWLFATSFLFFLVLELALLFGLDKAGHTYGFPLILSATHTSTSSSDSESNSTISTSKLGFQLVPIVNWVWWQIHVPFEGRFSQGVGKQPKLQIVISPSFSTLQCESGDVFDGRFFSSPEKSTNSGILYPMGNKPIDPFLVGFPLCRPNQGPYINSNLLACWIA